MNMKKTLAGVMAGAMAVSAMAATVSADQDEISLTYDLKTYSPREEDGTCVVTSSYTNSNNVAEYLVAYDANGYAEISFEAEQGYLSGKDIVSVEVVVTSKKDAGNANQEILRNEIKYTKDSAVAEKDSTFFFAPDGKIDTWNDTNTANDTQILNVDRDADGYKEVIIPISTDVSRVRVLNGKSYDLGNGYFGFSSCVAKVTYKIPAKIKVRTANGWNLWQANGDYINWGYTDAQYEALGITAYSDVTPTLEHLNSGLVCGDRAFVTMDANGVTTAVKPEKYSVTSMVAGKTSEAVFPFKTVLNPSYNTKYDAVGKPTVVGNNDVVAALKSRKADGNYYTNPIAVLNDAIANNEEVTFTFKTFGDYVATAKSNLYLQWVEADRAYGYKTCDYDWYNPAFSQHLYTNEYNTYSPFGVTNYDQYGSYSSAWGINLFSGAIVVNSGLTMQLNDTQKFYWGNDTLTFDWFTITDEGKITDAKTFLTSMLLYTPVDWYWDSLTVTVGNTEEDDIDTTSPVDDTAEEIPEEEEEIIFEEEEVIEEEVEEEVEEVEEVEEEVEEPEEVEEVVEEAAPVAPAPSPATGNAPVALAVIPVALAAAAVVAKKRG